MQTLPPFTHSWDNLSQADVGAKFKDGENECTILEVGASCKTFATQTEPNGLVFWNNIETAKKFGWTFLDDPPEPETVKMTVAEVSAEVSKARGGKVVVEIVE